MKDSLGDRMKRYENITRDYLVPRTYTIVRVDGKAFHTFTRGFNRPFDDNLVKMMNATAMYLAKKVQGCKLAYVQSDEISLVLTDFDEIGTSAWFDGNIQKIVSVAASMATAEFNRQFLMWAMANPPYGVIGIPNIIEKTNFAEFDARTFTIPTYTEVVNYLIWRQKDAERNSVQMVARSLYSHKETDKKNTDMLQEMIFQKGQNWNDYDDGLKRGRVIVRRPMVVGAPIEGFKVMGKKMYDSATAVRNKWVVENPPIFTQDRAYISGFIPNVCSNE